MRVGLLADGGREFFAGGRRERAVDRGAEHGGHDVADVVVGGAGGHETPARRAEVLGGLSGPEVRGLAGRQDQTGRGGEERAQALRDHVLDRHRHVLHGGAVHPGALEGEDPAVEDLHPVVGDPDRVGEHGSHGGGSFPSTPESNQRDGEWLRRVR